MTTQIASRDHTPPPLSEQVSNLPLVELAQRSAEETAKFARRASYDPWVCFELLRRALAEQSNEAFTHVYRIYEPLVTSWVYRHSRFAFTGESAEYFVSAAFCSFYFALRGDKFGRFMIPAAILSYLRSCVHTEISQYLRRHGPEHAPLEEVAEHGETAELGARAQVNELWDYIVRLLPRAHDQLLARCAFVLDLAPRQICAAYPAHWRSEREVSVDLYRIRRLLRADQHLAALAHGPL